MKQPHEPEAKPSAIAVNETLLSAAMREARRIERAARSGPLEDADRKALIDLYNATERAASHEWFRLLKIDPATFEREMIDRVSDE